MNTYTKKSLVHFILSLAALALGIAVFILLSGSLFDSMDQPVDEDAPFGEIGKAFTVIFGVVLVFAIGIIDAVFTSMFVYMFAYFSNNNAKYAIESGDTTNTPKALKHLSLIEMILAAIIAIVGGLLIIGIFAFM